MQENTRISTVQLICLMTISSVTLMITCNASQLGGNDLIDNLLSCGIAFLCNFILIIPTFLLIRRRNDCALLLQAESVGKWLLIAAVLFYILYFLFVDIQYLSTFQFFLGNAFRPAVPTWIFTAMILITAVYSAEKGLEAMGRTALIILILFLLGIIVISSLLLADIQSDNLSPLFYNGPSQTVTGTAFYLSGSTAIVSYGLLFSEAKGRRKLGFCFWNSITYSVAALILFLVVSTLGSYATLQLFPFYSAATLAELGTFQRMDSVFICIWLIGLFLKLAVDIYCIAHCINQFSTKALRTAVKPVAGVLIFVGAVLTAHSQTLLRFFLNPIIGCLITVGAAVIFPTITLVGNRIRKRGENHLA